MACVVPQAAQGARARGHLARQQATMAAQESALSPQVRLRLMHATVLTLRRSFMCCQSALS